MSWVYVVAAPLTWVPAFAGTTVRVVVPVGLTWTWYGCVPAPPHVHRGYRIRVRYDGVGVLPGGT